MAHQTHILEANNLAIGYGNQEIISNLDFKLPLGELCAIVGINGVGKSTLLRTLGHLQPMLGGTINLGDKALLEHSNKEIARQISLVLTEPIASKNLTVAELIALGRQPYTNWLGNLTQEDKVHVKKCIDDFELTHLKNKKCHQLSDGQLQRALVARAMTQDTPLILLDEPTTHLDLYHKVQILKLLQKLAHSFNKTIVFTTHEIELAIQLCDKMIVLDNDSNPFGNPCELIEAGHFDRLFPKEMVQFDPKSGSFKVVK
ncbi:MAG: ABC transporter ATP-binding protein [Croceitalea sp.]|nr:ABC transporter ATP-binding protein [Croceitalea sp.]